MIRLLLLASLLPACRAAAPADTGPGTDTSGATTTDSGTTTATQTATDTDTATGSGTDTTTGSGTDTGVSTGTETGSSGSLSDGFLATLGFRGGCGDVVFHARNDDDTLGLFVYIAGLATEAAAAGTPQEWTFPLDTPDPDVRVEVRQGVLVSDIVCDDVAEIESRVDARWTAVGGEARVRVAPDAATEWHTGTGTLTLTDVVFARDGDASEIVTGGDLEIADVFVGWLAG